MTHKCDKCGETTELIMKMGGLICDNCRTICFHPYDKDGVYDAEHKKLLLEMESGNGSN